MGPTYMLAIVCFGLGEGGTRGRGRMRTGMVVMLNDHVVPLGAKHGSQMDPFLF